MSDPASKLEARAQAWVEEVHPHAPHLICARDWVVELDPGASEALRVAAVLHDIERAFPDPDADWDSAEAWEDPAYLRYHQDRCADIATGWLAEQDADPATIEAVAALIRVHEDGGWPAADVLQAADSLSFFDTMTGLTVAWAQRGKAGPAERKLHYTLDRIRFEPARPPAAERLETALAELHATR